VVRGRAGRLATTAVAASFQPVESLEEDSLKGAGPVKGPRRAKEEEKKGKKKKKDRGRAKSGGRAALAPFEGRVLVP